MVLQLARLSTTSHARHWNNFFPHGLPVLFRHVDYQNYGKGSRTEFHTRGKRVSTSQGEQEFEFFSYTR